MSKNKHTVPRPDNGKLKGYRTAVLLLSIACLTLFLLLAKDSLLTRIGEKINRGGEAPHSESIREILAGLNYSIMPRLFKPEVTVSVDFPKQKWTLHNIHSFNPDGTVRLTDGKTGLCGDLAAHVYAKIQPLLGKEYGINFVRVAESGYFLNPRASHIALLINDPGIIFDREYLLDPSFQRYGLVEEFEEYEFFERMERLPFVFLKNKNEVFDIGYSTPVVIRKDFLVGLLVDRWNGRFDRDNFVLTLSATKRFKFAGRYILALVRYEGKDDVLESPHLAKILFKKEEYQKLKQKMLTIYSNIIRASENTENPPATNLQAD